VNEGLVGALHDLAQLAGRPRGHPVVEQFLVVLGHHSALILVGPDAGGQGDVRGGVTAPPFGQGYVEPFPAGDQPGLAALVVISSLMSGACPEAAVIASRQAVKYSRRNGCDG
jgi:hypothetical protein